MKKLVLLLCIALLMFTVDPVSAATTNAEAYALNEYDLRAGILPNGWTIEYIIEQSQAERVYRSIEVSCLEDGVICYIDWNVYLVGYSVSFEELQKLKTPQDLPDALEGNDCQIYMPIFAELEGKKRIIGYLKITSVHGEFQCYRHTYVLDNPRFLSGEDDKFWYWLGYADQVNPSYTPVDQGQYDTLVMVNVSPIKSCANYSELILGYNDHEGWMIHDHNDRSWSDPNARVSPLENYVAAAMEYEASIQPNEDAVRQTHLVIAVLGGLALIALLAVGAILFFLVRSLVRKFKRRHYWEG